MSFIRRHPFYTVLIVLGVTLLSVGTWLYTLTPSNDRTWTVDQAVLPYAKVEGDTATIYNIRNFSYTSTSTYTPAYYDKTFSLDTLQSVDYLIEPFDELSAGHTLLSFGFQDGSYVSISVEIRKEIGESFSVWKGVLRQYELMYVIADERDVIQLRTNYRKHRAYLYPLTLSQEEMRLLFLNMLARANILKETPEFYNTVTSNCLTNILDHLAILRPDTTPFDLRITFPEHSDEYLYEQGYLNTTLPFETLKERYYISEKAQAANGNLDFSQLIRE